MNFNKFQKISISFFLVIFLLSTFYFLFSDRALAGEGTTTIDLNCQTNPEAYPWCQEAQQGPGALVGKFYIIALGLAVAAAFGVLIYGAILWALSGAVTSKQDAKEWIWGAIWGLVLLLAAYLILWTINPDLIKLKSTEELFKIPAPSSTPGGGGGTGGGGTGGGGTGGGGTGGGGTGGGGTGGGGGRGYIQGYLPRPSCGINSCGKVCVSGISRNCNEMSTAAADNFRKYKNEFEMECRASGYNCSISITSTLTGNHASQCHHYGNSLSGTCADFVITGCGNDSSCLNTALNIATNSTTLKKYYRSCLNEYIPGVGGRYRTGSNIHCNF